MNINTHHFHFDIWVSNFATMSLYGSASFEEISDADRDTMLAVKALYNLAHTHGWKIWLQEGSIREINTLFEQNVNTSNVAPYILPDAQLRLLNIIMISDETKNKELPELFIRFIAYAWCYKLYAADEDESNAGLAKIKHIIDKSYDKKKGKWKIPFMTRISQCFDEHLAKKYHFQISKAEIHN